MWTLITVVYIANKLDYCFCSQILKYTNSKYPNGWQFSHTICTFLDLWKILKKPWSSYCYWTTWKALSLSINVYFLSYYACLTFKHSRFVWCKLHRTLQCYQNWYHRMKKDGSSKGFCLEFFTLRTIYNKSSALRRTGQENPNYEHDCSKAHLTFVVKSSSLRTKNPWEEPVPLRIILPLETSVCWSQAFQTVPILSQKRPAMIQTRLHRWLLMNPT